MTATTEALEETTAPGAPSPWLRFFLALVAALAASLLIGAGALIAYDQAYAGRVRPGVRVGSVDLSGLTPDAARAELRRVYGSLSDGRIVLTGVEEPQVIAYSEIGRGPDTDALLDAAMAVGRRGSPLDRAVADVRTALRGVALEPRVTFDPDELSRRVDAIAGALRVEPLDSIVAVRPDGTFAVVPGHVGRVADPSPALRSLLAELRRLDAPSEIRFDLGVSVIEPEVSAVEAFEARLTAERVTNQIQLIVGEEKLPIEAAELRDWLTFRKTGDGDYESVMDTSPLTSLLEAFAERINQEPINARFVTSNGKITEITQSQDGYKLDVPATVAQIQALLAARTAGAETTELVPALAVTPPGLTYRPGRGRRTQDGQVVRVDRPTSRSAIKNGIRGQHLDPGADDRRLRRRSARDVRLLGGDRAGHPREGLSRRWGDHQRPDGAAGRAGRRDLLVLDHAVQRRPAGGLRDGRPAQPLLLHRPLPAGAGRDRLHQRLRLGPDDVLDERHGLPGADPRLQDQAGQPRLRQVRALRHPERPNQSSSASRRSRTSDRPAIRSC